MTADQDGPDHERGVHGPGSQGPGSHGPGSHGHRRRGIVARLRANFITGLVVIAPIGFTLWLIWTVTGWTSCCVC